MENEAGRKYRVCGCTDNDCRQCIEKTGGPAAGLKKICVAHTPGQSLYRNYAGIFPDIK
jgi:hypothetical protein